MRVFCVASVLVLTCSASLAAGRGCLSDFSVDSWSAVYSRQSDKTMLWLGLQNATHSEVVMVDGQVEFTDALGNVLEPFPMTLPPDIKIPANGGVVAELWPKGESRLTKVDAKLVTVSVCVRGYVASDGAVVKAAP